MLRVKHFNYQSCDTAYDKVDFASNKVARFKDTELLFIVSLNILSWGVPAETGLPCFKAAVLEESVNETPNITYTIKTQLMEKLGKTRK